MLSGNFNRFATAMFYLFSTIQKRVRFVIYDKERIELDGDVFRKVEIDNKMVVVLREIMNGRYKIEEIEKVTGISKATISRIRRKLERMELVKKVNGGKYCITERGKIVVYDGEFFRNVKKEGRYYEDKILYT
ncbi:Trp family transcriptional regulator [Saccharolobus sp. E5-1-F]|uniref:Trp family transcriptional regulator n=1 Tax=Saccharolobus sp. E5-1-F TaxID=2663019 RepID=UPI001EE96A3C|nr:Trp family transcriptional regulator [Sulfolobus sp. E5-1-F]